MSKTQPDDLIERIAKAIYCANAAIWFGTSWEEEAGHLYSSTREAYIREARAALLAAIDPPRELTDSVDASSADIRAWNCIIWQALKVSAEGERGGGGGQ